MSILNNGSKSQSAMEYLMTYGWAIVIIAVVLVILYSLNVFSPSLATACVGTPGYACSNPLISSQGLLSFTLGVNGATAYNVLFSCASNSDPTPPNMLPYNATTNSYVGIAPPIIYTTTSNSAASLSTPTGGTVTVSSIQCYPSAGGTANMLSPIGTEFSGSIWMAYSPTRGDTQLSYVKIASFSAKSSS